MTWATCGAWLGVERAVQRWEQLRWMPAGHTWARQCRDGVLLLQQLACKAAGGSCVGAADLPTCVRRSRALNMS